MTKIINLFAGPGAGKSTLAAGLFYELKMQGHNVELALEYAKDLTWEERFNTLSIQPYVLGKQYHRLMRLVGKVEAVITDSPILLSSVYGGLRYRQSFHDSVMHLFDAMDNLNFYVVREKPYNPKGRNQTENEAKQVDDVVFRYLVENDVKFMTLSGSRDGLKCLVAEVLANL